MAAKCTKELSSTYDFSSVVIYSDSLLNLQPTYRHVESNNNIADIITKGSLMSDLLSNKQWWNGPPMSAKTIYEFTVATDEAYDDRCTTNSDYAKALGPYRQIAKWLKGTFMQILTKINSL